MSWWIRIRIRIIYLQYIVHKNKLCKWSDCSLHLWNFLLYSQIIIERYWYSPGENWKTRLISRKLKILKIWRDDHNCYIFMRVLSADCATSGWVPIIGETVLTKTGEANSTQTLKHHKNVQIFSTSRRSPPLVEAHPLQKRSLFKVERLTQLRSIVSTIYTIQISGRIDVNLSNVNIEAILTAIPKVII